MKRDCKVSIFDELKINMYCHKGDWIKMLKMSGAQFMVSKGKDSNIIPKTNLVAPEPKRNKHVSVSPR